MTCIAGIAENGTVWIGGDSAGVSGWNLRTRADEKVFRNGPFLIGYTSSFRMGQLLRFRLTPPSQKCRDDYRFMATDFIDAIRECFKAGGYQKRECEQESGGDFLVGYNGRLYEVRSDYQVARFSDSIAAVGCGFELALGAMFATSGNPKARIRTALKAAEAFNAGVRSPFVIRSLK